MDSIKLETDPTLQVTSHIAMLHDICLYSLQQQAASWLCKLLELCKDRVPCPNPKIIKNLCQFLCADASHTPPVMLPATQQAREGVELWTWNAGIITLTNYQSKVLPVFSSVIILCLYITWPYLDKNINTLWIFTNLILRIEGWPDCLLFLKHDGILAMLYIEFYSSHSQAIHGQVSMCSLLELNKIILLYSCSCFASTSYVVWPQQRQLKVLFCLVYHYDLLLTYVLTLYLPIIMYSQCDQLQFRQ